VRNPKPLFERYETYKAALRASGRAVNEVRRFHATGMTCDFGVDQSQAPCDDDGCAVCSIGATAFKLRHAGGGALTANFGCARARTQTPRRRSAPTLLQRRQRARARLTAAAVRRFAVRSWTLLRSSCFQVA
jgi:hypothetical protein